MSINKTLDSVSEALTAHDERLFEEAELSGGARSELKTKRDFKVIGGKGTRHFAGLDRALEEAEQSGSDSRYLIRNLRIFTAVGARPKRDAGIHKEFFDRGLARLEAAGVVLKGIEWKPDDWRVAGFIYSVHSFVTERYLELADLGLSPEKTVEIQTKEIRAFLESREDGPRGRLYRAMTPAGLKNGWEAAELGELIVLGIFAAEADWTGLGSCQA